MDDGDQGTPLPVLLRAGRRTYGTAMRAALEAAGYDDIPANGLFVLGAVAGSDAPLSDIIAALGASKQAAGALVDTLVTRGYLDRSPDPVDRRRLVVACTERGAAAAEIIGATAQRVDAELTDRVGADHVAATRATLVALAALATPADRGAGGA